MLLTILALSSITAFSQKATGKLTSFGYWIHDKVEEIPDIITCPFVPIGDGNILTVERNMSLISKDEGKTWDKSPFFLKRNQERSGIQQYTLALEDTLLLT